MSALAALALLIVCGGLMYLALAYMPLEFSKGTASKYYDRYVIGTLRKPFKRTLTILLGIVMGMSILMSLSPLPVVHFVYSFTDWKLWTKLMRLQTIRSLADGFYLYVMQKRILSLLYTVFSLIVLVMILPFTLAMQIIGNLDYMRVLAFMVVGPVLIMHAVRKGVEMFVPEEDEYGDVRKSFVYTFARAPNNTSLLVNAITAYAILIIVAMTTYNNNPSLYDFCFHKFPPSAVASMLVASGVFVHVAMVIYTESERAGRRAFAAKSRIRDIAKKHREMTLVSLCAVVIGAMFMRQWNAGYVEREALLHARFYALE